MTKKTLNGTTKVVKTAATTTAEKSATSAFFKPMTPSVALAAIVGASPLPRTQVVKKLWEYIKTNNLQDVKNKRVIKNDAKMKKVFSKPSMTMFEMSGLIGPQLS